MKLVCRKYLDECTSEIDSQTKPSEWCNRFHNTGGLLHTDSPGTSEAEVEHIEHSFMCSLKRSVRNFNWEMQINKSAVRTVLCERIHLHADKLLLFQSITEEDKVICFCFATCVRYQLAENEDYLAAVLFTDEATFCTSGVINRHSCHI